MGSNHKDRIELEDALDVESDKVTSISIRLRALKGK